MNLGVVRAYMLKEIKELIRSRMLVLVYLLPTMIIILFGYGIRLEVTHARTVILDHDRSKLSRDLISHFEHSRYFDTRVMDITEAQALHRIKQAKTEILLIIPEGFEKRLIQGVGTEIGVFVDGAFPIRGETMANYVEGVIFDAARRLMPPGRARLITLDNRNLFNPDYAVESASDASILGVQGCRREAQAHPEGALSIRFDRPCRR